MKDEILEKLNIAKEILEECLTDCMIDNLPCDDIHKAVNRVFEASVILESEDAQAISEKKKKLKIEIETVQVSVEESLNKVCDASDEELLDRYPDFFLSLKENLNYANELCKKFIREV